MKVINKKFYFLSLFTSFFNKNFTCLNNLLLTFKGDVIFKITLDFCFFNINLTFFKDYFYKDFNPFTYEKYGKETYRSCRCM